jgi:NAD(P)-dependent dehydrogenase (short-subunit alcohol dehydrogenase family)
MTMIITGANRGLGYETALALAADTSRSIALAGRDLPGLTAAAQRIQSLTGNANLVPLPLDLAALASVRAFVAEFRTRDLPPLTSIICNAGISKSTARECSADGYEVTFAVNHLGHFLLVNLLLDRLQPPARIIFVSSDVHDPAQLSGPIPPPRYVKAEWLAYPERDSGLHKNDRVAGGQAYASSKLCNVLCAYELARRLEASGLSTPARPITVNAFDPGFMPGTELGRDGKGIIRFMWYSVMPFVSRFMPFVHTTTQSGGDLAYLATAPDLAAVTGKYFSGRDMVPSSAESHDLGKAADLWQTSITLADLKQTETILPSRLA